MDRAVVVFIVYSFILLLSEWRGYVARKKVRALELSLLKEKQKAQTQQVGVKIGKGGTGGHATSQSTGVTIEDLRHAMDALNRALPGGTATRPRLSQIPRLPPLPRLPSPSQIPSLPPLAPIQWRTESFSLPNQPILILHDEAARRQVTFTPAVPSAEKSAAQPKKSWHSRVMDDDEGA